MEMLLIMVICDKKVNHYKFFAGQEEIKRILGDIRYNVNDIVVILSRVECFIVLDLDTDSNYHQEEAIVINAPTLNTIHANFAFLLNTMQANSSPLFPVIILD